MKDDFFAATAPYLPTLNQTDRNIYDYVTRNIETVKDESIRMLSHECFVSTATMFRFVQKLGFSGYADFINLLRLTYYTSLEQSEPKSASLEAWVQDYIENVSATLHAFSEEKASRFYEHLQSSRSVLLLADEDCREAAYYARRLFCMQGKPCFVLASGYEMKTAECNITRDDMLLVLTTTGQNQALLEQIRRLRAEQSAYLVAITGQKHGSLQKLCDLSIPVSSGENGQLLSGAIIAAIDLLAHDCQRQADGAAE